MIVKSLIWISKEAKEAELVISDGNFECIAFSQPCHYQVGDHINDPLEAFITEDVMISFENNVGFKKNDNNSFSYTCHATIVNVESSLVKIGNIYIILDNKLPNGCIEGNIVDFNCNRLDII